MIGTVFTRLSRNNTENKGQTSQDAPHQSSRIFDTIDYAMKVAAHERHLLTKIWAPF
jgi:hypothetical protein